MQNVQNKNSFFPAFQCLSVSVAIGTFAPRFSKGQFTQEKLLLKKLRLLQIPITLQKEISLDHEGKEVSKCGFKIGGQ